MSKKDSKTELLFVYGSLKKGFDNHNLLSKDAAYIGKAITVDKYGMFGDSFGNYPYLISIPIMQIHGEVYHIKSEDLWQRLDEFEGAPEYYDRQKILVTIDDSIQSAFVYIQPHSNAPKDQEPLNEWTQ